ncbi:thiolase family protein [Desulfofustis glycolicus]|uniref:acetyl-CoA C-acyltransferase n=1 Tax=Desulfofustis glycolicus DSM 9705 TaxID=1121409 RepID=A0A1M5YA65_9BACT|nr:thiolase family protein [Desulfofustis glycolicus]MCB2218470.1 thiolase family protein [Desulfobulbaceae bacterium]SHI08981.1 acetyl-CoA acyltransferase [Desulfofustis glycolicus DSM 9705]
MKTAYILASYRTPGCRANKGKFKDMRPDDLAATAIKGLVERTGIEPATVDDIYLGCAFPEAEQGMNLGRMAGLKAGLPIEVPGQTINRFCCSGVQTISMAAERVMLGLADCIVAGGTESMSCVPLGGLKYSANPSLVEDWPEAYSSMGITAELVAERYGIDRQAMDEFAVDSHARAAAAIEAGRFTDEIIPVTVEKTQLVKGKIKRTTEEVVVDDGVRPGTTIETLSKLRPAFKLGGTVTAGNSSQMTDGAAFSLVVSEDYLKRLGGEPMARFIAYAVRGVAPEVMGIGPIAAIPAVLEMADMKLSDIGLIELNEAFAAQALAVVKELGIDRSILNVNGGAIALGHPLGCTGAKITATLLHEMGRRKARYGLVTMCIGGGMGAAGIFERL